MFRFLPPTTGDAEDTGAEENDDLTGLRSFEEIRFDEKLHTKIVQEVASTAFQAGKGQKSGAAGIKGLVINQLLKTPCLSEYEETGFLKTLEGASSDLLPGTYEGGFKVWECSFDLIDYLCGINFNASGLKVLDLGCGAGILGLFCFENKQVQNVDFHDYNREVVNFLTIPNVLVNSSETLENIKKSRFYSGDWKYFEEPYDYDIILSSETIYNISTVPKLISLVKRVLKPSGIFYLAAKTFYFGVGGGTRQFRSLIDKDGQLTHETVWTTKEGVQREIIKITFKK